MVFPQAALMTVGKYYGTLISFFRMFPMTGKGSEKGTNYQYKPFAVHYPRQNDISFYFIMEAKAL